MALRIGLSPRGRWGAVPLSLAIVEAARRRGLAGATVLRGVPDWDGTDPGWLVWIFRGSRPSSLIVEIVDEAKAIEAFLPLLEEMTQDGQLTLRPVRRIRWGHPLTPSRGREGGTT